MILTTKAYATSKALSIQDKVCQNLVEGKAPALALIES